MCARGEMAESGSFAESAGYTSRSSSEPTGYTSSSSAEPTGYTSSSSPSLLATHPVPPNSPAAACEAPNPQHPASESIIGCM